MLTASSEPCIGTDGQVASISRENHAFCAGRADLLPDYSVKERLKRQHAKIRLRNVVPYGNLALNRPSLGGHLGNVGLNRGCAHGSDCLMKLDEVNHYS